MARPTTRDEFKQYILRKLGAPVIEINVSDEQIEDRIDECLEYYHDYHYDGSEKMYYKHIITQADKDNQYISLPEGVEPTHILNPPFGVSSGMFNVEYQYALNNIDSISGGNITNFVMAMTQMRFMEDIFNGWTPIRFNRHTDRIMIDTDWSKWNVGDYVVIAGYKRLDTDTYSDVWSDRWLQEYATAKVQENWGRNLSKFEGMQLPGGVTFNGQQILQDAQSDILRLEEDMVKTYSIPTELFIG